MSTRLGRALRGQFLLCAALLGFAALPAMAQVRHEGAIPDGRGGVGILTAGVGHTCALRQDGTASCWGFDDNGKVTPPPGAFMELSATFENTCGLRGDGSVECWGAGFTARDGNPPPPAPPAMSGTFTALASGMQYTCGLHARALPWQYPEGNVACWSGSPWAAPLAPPPAGDFAALSVGDRFVCGLRADGHAECWGDIDPAMVPQGAFIAVTAGQRHACGLRADGSVQCWGDNGDGQATPPAELFTAISAGAFNTCGIRTDGLAQCWGANWAGQSTPPMDPEARFSAISVGVHHACGIRTDGQAVCWGNTDWGSTYGPTPRPYEGAFGVGQLAAGDWHQCQVGADGRLSCWGGMTPEPAPGLRFSAVAAGWESVCGRDPLGHVLCFGNNSMVRENLPFEPLRQFDVGYEHACGVLALDGRARCWGRETNGKTLAPEGLFRNLSAGLMHSCGVAADGTGQCWGYNGDGQAMVPALPPQQGFLSIQAGERHSCALDSALHIKCWGMSPPPVDPNAPANPEYNPDFATFRALSVGAYHSCAIRTDGRLLCWGENWSGQLQTPEGSFVAVAAGHDHSCAIRTDGRRECWSMPWTSPKLVMDPDALPGLHTNQWLDVRFNLRNESPYLLQEPHYAIVAGSLPETFRLEADGHLFGSWHQTGRFPITVEGRDRNGFAVRRDYVLVIDDTPPVIEPLVTGTQGDNGWYVSPVDVRWSLTDPESDIRWSVGCDPAQVQSETTDAGFFCHAESAGGPADRDVHVRVDLLAPNLRLVGFEATGAQAKISFEGDDAMSGLAGFECSLDGAEFATCVSPVHSTFGPGQHDLQIRAVDNAGHRSAPVSQQWFTDPTAPRVFADVTGPQGTNEWYTGDVHIQWQISDDESPITSMTGCETTTLTSDTPEAIFPCTAVSRGGTTEQSVYIRRDTVAPETRLISTPAAVINATSATFEFDGSDATSGVAGYECRFDSSYQWQPCASPKRYDNLGHGQHVFYVRAIDAAGHRDELEAGYAFKVDTTPPQIIAGQSAQWGSNGWAIGDVQVSFAIDEPESSYTSTPGCQAFVQNTDTAGTSITCSATSVGGTSSNTVVVRRDTVAPETRFLSAPATGTSTSAGFAFTGDDATSGVAGYECSLDGATFTACVSPYAFQVASGAHTFSVRARDRAGHLDASAATHSWTVDSTPPTIVPSVTGTLGNNGWYVGNALIAWTVSDAESAIVSSTGCNTVSLTTDTPGASFTCTVTNAVGVTVSRTVTIKRDATAPTLAPTVAAEMLLNATNTATANGSDAVSGIASASCVALATGTVGSKSVGCTVSDGAGNTASASASYRVVYGFNGFTSPVQNPSVLNVLKAGRSVQLRWRVVDAQGAPVSGLTSANVGAVAISCPTATENRISVFGGSNGQLQNLGNGYYQLDWMAASSLRNACRRLELNLGDGLLRPALFKFN
ncbi:MAG TPA: PxKF domain-containing protein [Lysobacter sp.]